MNNYQTINISENCGKITAAQSGIYNIMGSSSENIIVEINESVNVEIVDLSLNCNITLTLSKDSSVKVVTLKCDQSNSRYNINIEGTGANFELYGVSVANKSDNIIISTMVHHKKGDARSHQYIKCIGADKSNTLFEGTVHIVEGAGGSLAYQQNKNILLSDSAQISSRPWLEIYADDVKCSHGSTTGMINEEEIFYMRQRGISLQSAKKLQMQGFALDIVEHITNQKLKDIASEKIINHIESL